MESSDYFTDEDEELYQQATVEESGRESALETKYKKLLDSDTEISNISSIYRLEIENSNNKESETIKENKNGEKNAFENDKEEKSEKAKKEENIELDVYSEKEIEEKKEEDNCSDQTFEDSNNIRSNYTFIWDEGGKDVKLTGSFSDWKIQYQMTKDPNDQKFKIQLPLNNEIYQYKFIVDGKWRCSKSFPTKEDGNGNINNFLDNTKNILVMAKDTRKQEKNEKKDKKMNESTKKTTKIIQKSKTTKNKKKSRISTKTKTAKTRASTINKDKITKNVSVYQSQYPSDDDISPLPLPNERYFESFKLEDFSNQKSIGNKIYYDFYDRYCFSFEASSRPIFVLGHVNLNHLISVKQNNKSKILKNCMSFRFREKATTFIYYK